MRSKGRADEFRPRDASMFSAKSLSGEPDLALARRREHFGSTRQQPAEPSCLKRRGPGDDSRSAGDRPLRQFRSDPQTYRRARAKRCSLSPSHNRPTSAAARARSRGPIAQWRPGSASGWHLHLRDALAAYGGWSPACRSLDARSGSAPFTSGPGKTRWQSFRLSRNCNERPEEGWPSGLRQRS